MTADLVGLALTCPKKLNFLNKKNFLIITIEANNLSQKQSSRGILRKSFFKKFPKIHTKGFVTHSNILKTYRTITIKKYF